MTTGVLVLTKAGLELARKLRDEDPAQVVVFGPSCVVGQCDGPSPAPHGPSPPIVPGAFPTGEPGVFGWTGPLRQFVPGVWEHCDAIVAIMALGIVVRLVGPLARDKREDPAVVAVDDTGRFAISVLGGHAADANRLAGQVAETLGAVPVITTASEARGLPAVDQVGRELGWTIERPENLARVAAAVVRGETIAVWQDAGPRDWWVRFGSWPAHFVRLETWDHWQALRPSALLVISDRVLPEVLPNDRVVVYRPRSLVAGIGCRKGVPREAIEAWVEGVMTARGFALASLSAVATVSLKAKEPGLVAFAKARGLPLVAFSPDELADQPGIENPSERVRSKIGIAAVAEPAALRAAGATRLLVPKQKGPGITLALARRSS